jgi:hypothetical protein
MDQIELLATSPESPIAKFIDKKEREFIILCRGRYRVRDRAFAEGRVCRLEIPKRWITN